MTDTLSGWPAPIAVSPVAIDPSATPDIAALLIGLFGLIWLAGTTVMLLPQRDIGPAAVVGGREQNDHVRAGSGS